jgi:hypothetical protein
MPAAQLMDHVGSGSLAYAAFARQHDARVSLAGGTDLV